MTKCSAVEMPHAREIKVNLRGLCAPKQSPCKVQSTVNTQYRVAN